MTREEFEQHMAEALEGVSELESLLEETNNLCVDFEQFDSELVKYMKNMANNMTEFKEYLEKKYSNK